MARVTIDSKVLEKLVEYASAYADHADDTAHELGHEHPNGAGYARQAEAAAEAVDAGQKALRSRSHEMDR